MRALTRKVIKDILHRKLRTTLTIVGIAIGIMGLSAINIAAGQLGSSFTFSSQATPDITFYTSPTSATLADLLRQQPNVKLVQAQRTVSTRWTIPSGHFPIDITGFLDMQHSSINKFELVEGTLPGAGQILLESSDRGIVSLRVGDTIQVSIGGTLQKLSISGFARTRGQSSASLTQRASGYMREGDLERLFHSPGVNRFLIQINNYNQRTATARQLATVFDAHHVLVLGSSVGHDTSLSTLSDGLFGTMRVLSIIALLLSAFLLLGTITALIAEQLPIIGTMKAIGGRQWQLIRHYLILVTLYGIVGTLLGLILGILGGYLLVNYLGGLVNLDIGPLEVPPLLILESIAIGIGVPLLSAALPVYIGTRITVHQALSGYGLESYATGRGKGWASFAGRLFGFFPQTMQFGMRGLFRKRTRAILTLITLVMAGAAFLAVQETTYSFDTFLSQVFNTYHFDIVVSLPSPMPYSTWQQLLDPVPGIAKTEQLNWLSVQTKWGSGLLTGVQMDAQLYQRQMVSGRWFAAGDQNVTIISEDAAAKARLKVGDTVSFHDTLHTASWHIIGIARDYNDLSTQSFGVLLAPMAQVNSFLHLPGNVTRIVMIQSSSSTPSAINALATRIDNTLSAAGFLPSVSTAQQQIQSNQNSYQILYTLLYVVTIIVALVGAIGLFNSLAMSVLERRREIGILRSMGATGRNVAQVFWTEGLALGIIAWIVALLIGIPAAYGFVLLLGKILVPVPFAFNPISLLWMLGFIVVIASLASVGPVWGAMRVKIVQTLRYE